MVLPPISVSFIIHDAVVAVVTAASVAADATQNVAAAAASVVAAFAAAVCLAFFFPLISFWSSGIFEIVRKFVFLILEKRLKARGGV